MKAGNGKSARTPLVSSNEKIFAIDPGNISSAWVVLTRRRIIGAFAKETNSELMMRIQNGDFADCDRMVIESPRPRGQSASWQLFQTCIWVGRFQQLWWPKVWTEADRRTIKSHLCETTKATDSQVRAALVAKWGGQDLAIGSKKLGRIGPLHGISKDVWQALAVGVAFIENGL